MVDSIESPVTYAIGDLHGEVTLLRRLLATLPLRDEDTVVFIGDYMDRGEDSIATVLALIEFQQRHPRCVFVRGNHDEAWLEKWDDLCFEGPPDIEGALDVWENCAGKIPYAVGFWLEQTRIGYEDQYAYYVHGGLEPGRTLQGTANIAKIWGVRGFRRSDYDWGKPVVFGHWISPEPISQPNKIGIDTGAYKHGVLTAVRLPDRTFFQARREW
jgi:serine/threonine protein phosphatase 1